MMRRFPSKLATTRPLWSTIVTLSLLMASTVSHAQDGPPLVTGDPDTPGDNLWEIKVASIVSHNQQRIPRLTAPDLDINCGWGDRMQLKLDLPITLAHDPNSGGTMGAGSTEFGVK